MRGQSNFDFFARGAVGGGGFKTNLNKKVRGSRQIFFFTYNLCLDYFLFFKWEGKAGRGDDSGQLKKFKLQSQFDFFGMGAMGG